MGMIDSLKDNTRLVWLRSRRSKIQQKVDDLRKDLDSLNAEIVRLER